MATEVWQFRDNEWVLGKKEKPQQQQHTKLNI